MPDEVDFKFEIEIEDEERELEIELKMVMETFAVRPKQPDLLWRDATFQLHNCLTP